MKDKYKTEGQLLEEFAKLCHRTNEFLRSETERTRAEQAAKRGRYKTKSRK